jgi:hypothetical protein
VAFPWSANDILTAADLNAAIGSTNGGTQHLFAASGSLSSAAVSGARKLLVEVWGGGGGGGGAPGNAAGNSACGGGGGGGGYAMAFLTVSSLTFPLAVTVGAAGTAGGSGANPGGAGGTSSVIGNNGAGTVHARALGGAAGVAGASGAALGAAASQGLGGIPNAGDLLITGGSAGMGLRFTAGACYNAAGGDSPRGGNGGYQFVFQAGGVTGTTPGGGGSGAVTLASGGSAAGGAGAPGYVSILAIY